MFFYDSLRSLVHLWGCVLTRCPLVGCVSWVTLAYKDLQLQGNQTVCGSSMLFGGDVMETEGQSVVKSQTTGFLHFGGNSYIPNTSNDKLKVVVCCRDGSICQCRFLSNLCFVCLKIRPTQFQGILKIALQQSLHLYQLCIWEMDVPARNPENHKYWIGREEQMLSIFIMRKKEDLKNYNPGVSRSDTVRYRHLEKNV